MKKVLGLSLSALMVMALAACGGNNDTGSTLVTDYTYVYVSDLDNLDYVSTNKANNHEHNANFIEGLLENDRYGKYIGAVAEKYESNEDATVWTFYLREGVKWVQATGEEYGKDVTAHDFVTGLQHAADANSETLNLVSGMIVGLQDYKDGKVGFEEVGVKALDDYTLEYTLIDSVPYFYSMTTYPILFPIQKDFLESKGCTLGEPKSDSCAFGTTAPDSILYSGPFILTANDAKSKITYMKNQNYWDVENVYLDTVTYVYDDGSDEYSIMKGFESGTYVAATLSTKWADYDTYAEKYADQITLAMPNEYSFGVQWNFNRVNFNYTNKTEEEQKAAQEAIYNKNVRLAVQAAYDTVAYMMQSMTEEVANSNLRNLNSVPDLVSTSDGTSYGTLVTNAYNELTGKSLDLNDGHAAYFNPDAAKEYIAAAEAEGIVFPVTFDVLMPNDIGEIYINRALSMKESIEKNTDGKIIIDVQLQPYDTVADVAFDMSDPTTAADYDFNTFSGWGPDYLDPKTFADTFSIINGDYLKNIGLLKTGDPVEDAKIDEIEKKVGLDKYQELLDAADAIKGDLDARYAAYAEADAYLLAEGLYLPNSMQSRSSRVTRVVPFSAPYAMAGMGKYKMKYVQVQEDIVTKEQYDAAQAEWESKK